MKVSIEKQTKNPIFRESSHRASASVQPESHKDSLVAGLVEGGRSLKTLDIYRQHESRCSR